MRVSERGLRVIQYYEGLRLQPYADMGGRQAIGYGHHIRPGEDFSKGISRAKAEKLLLKDLEVARYHIADKVKVPLTQGQYDALASFVFNVGAGNFAGSTLLKKLNSGDYDGAAREFDRWTMGGRPARTLRGLVARRQAEKDLFTSM
ncbi:MAG TPA: lysozyme [Candidatus Obscuribacterales bacterium]